MKAFKAFIKLFEAQQRSVKIKIYINFSSSSGIGTGRVNFILELYQLNSILIIMCISSALSYYFRPYPKNKLFVTWRFSHKYFPVLQWHWWVLMSKFNYKSFRRFLIEILLVVQVSPNLPANIYLFKVNNKNTRMTSMTSHFEHISVVDLE